MGQQRPLILAVGEILWDLLPSGKQLGGAPANFAYHAAQLGADARTISAVGADPLGSEILGRLRELQLDTNLISIDAKRPTGSVTVALGPQGQPTYTIHENVAWDFLPWTPEQLDVVRKADCICFGSLAQRSPVSRHTVHAIIDTTPRGAIRVFDINLRQHYYDAHVIESSLNLADVLKINDEELPVLGKLLALTNPIPQHLFKRFESLRLIALTRGGVGSVLYAHDGATDEHPGYPVPPAYLVDTIGAGDAFTAAVAVGLLRKLPIPRINDAANRLASYVCTQRGATPIIPPDLLAHLD
jgi:fructokinase